MPEAGERPMSRLPPPAPDHLAPGPDASDRRRLAYDVIFGHQTAAGRRFDSPVRPSVRPPRNPFTQLVPGSQRGESALPSFARSMNLVEPLT